MKATGKVKLVGQYSLCNGVCYG